MRIRTEHLPPASGAPAGAGGQWPAPEGVWRGTAGFALSGAASTIDGGRLDVMLAGPSGLRHGWAGFGRDGGLERWSEPEPVRARYWVDGGTAPSG